MVAVKKRDTKEDKGKFMMPAHCSCCIAAVVVDENAHLGLKQH